MVGEEVSGVYYDELIGGKLGSFRVRDRKGRCHGLVKTGIGEMLV